MARATKPNKPRYMPRNIALTAMATILLALSAGSAHALGLPIETNDNGSVMSGLANTIAQALQSKISTLNAEMTANTISTNGERDTNVAATDATATKYATQSSYSACSQAGSAGGTDNNRAGTAAVGGAMTQGGEKRPTGPAADAQDLQAEITDGLVPCGTGDPDASTYKAMNCTPQWGGAFENADLSMDVLFGSDSDIANPSSSVADHQGSGTSGLTGNLMYELPVPPTFKNLKNGDYQPLPTNITDEKYMPFVAAYSFCQRINPRRQSLPPATQGQATIAVIGASAKGDADAKLTTAYSMCMHLLAERMQYGTEDSQFAALHSSETGQCTKDTNALWFDTANNSYCQTHGRSTLQAMHDLAYRDEFTNYQAQYLTSADNQTLLLMGGFAQQAHANFDAYVQKERADLTAAIAAANQAATVSVDNALGQPIK
ncbi:MAG: hypothetical protein KGI37_09925 [Alphaproteobacteria bacterium]|nr:hypothetical protein [Alphaproteobacteria bacterium]